jgi:two-component sensor histidine kinase
MSGVSSDITDRKRSEEHREFLAAELNHRVKNSMATMQSIAHQTLRNASTVEQALTDLNARLHSLASAHDVLTRESWDGAALTDIIAGALRPFATSKERFDINGPYVWLSSQMSLAMVMALHELATNAVKYGALSNNDGRVELKWHVTTDDAARRLHLRWEESGGPTVTPPTRRGFGSRMIERVLAAEFGGTAQVRYLPGGVTFKIDAPLPARGLGN